MKKLVFFGIIILGFISSNAQLIHKNKKNNIVKHKEISLIDYLSTKKVLSHPTLKGWINYYKENIDKNFNLSSFNYLGVEKIITKNGQIEGVYDKNFNEIYRPFLIFSPNNMRYVDMESNNWFLENDINKSVTFEPGQQVILLFDVKNKKCLQIFSHNFECKADDAFWINNSTIVFLENVINFEIKSYQTRISIVDINTYKIKKFMDNKTRYIESDYYYNRLRKTGNYISKD